MKIKQKIAQNEEILCTACIRKNPVTSFCTDCATLVLMCKECFQHHKYSRDKQGHSTSVIQLDEIRSEKIDVRLKNQSTEVEWCAVHEKKLKFYCETCDKLICHYCATSEHTGDKHKHYHLKTMTKQFFDKMDEVVKPLDVMIHKLATSEKEILYTYQ